MSLPIFNQLIELTAYRGIEQWLSHALTCAMYILNAQAGSLLLAADEPRLVRQGIISKKAWMRLAAWEKGISQSLGKAPRYVKTIDTSLLSKTKLNEKALLVSAPLLSDKRVVGALSLSFTDADSFGLVQRELMVLLIRWLGAAGDVLRQLTTAQARLNQLDLLNEIARQTATLDLTHIIKSTIAMTTRALNATAASILLINEPKPRLPLEESGKKVLEHRGAELIFEIVYGEKEDLLTKRHIAIEKGIAGWVATHGEPYMTNAAATDPLFNSATDLNTGFTTNSVLAVPLQLSGQTIGVLEVLNKQSPLVPSKAEGFTARDQRLLQTIAGQVALAIDNAKLYHTVQEEKEQIIHTEQAVKQELARNLHDGPVQLLAQISWGLDILLKKLPSDAAAARQEIADLQQLTKQANREARLQMFTLHPLILEERGLAAALEYYWEQLQRDVPKFQLVDETTAQRLGVGVEQVIFSIGREAIGNALKHADAANIKVRLSATAAEFILTVTDDGAGFDLPRVQAQYAEYNKLGLLNMQERAARLGGALAIETQPGRGTTITLRVPK